MMYNKKDYATSLVVNPPIPANSGTTLTVTNGEGVRFPNTPFYATASPADYMPTLDNAEKILVTDVTGDTLTFQRAQGDTTAKYIVVGWRISNTVFAADIDTKLDKKTAITPASHTKISYDANGLVTGGTDITTADVPDSLNKRYISDSKLAVVNNTSGVNTGDQDLSGKVDKVNGKALSTNDYTTAEKNKLAGIEAGAEVNNISDSEANELTGNIATNLHKHSYLNLNNKPSIPDELSDLSSDSLHRTVTDTEKSTWNNKQDAMGDDDNYVTDLEKANLHAPHSDDQVLPTKTSDLTNDSNFVVDADYVHTDNNYTDEDSQKLDGIENNANNYVLETHGNDKHTSSYITADDIPFVPSKVSDLEIDIDTDDIPETATNMYVPTLPSDSPTSKYLNGNKEWQEISVSSDRIIELNKTDGYSNYAITESFKYTFTRDEDGIIETILKEEV